MAKITPYYLLVISIIVASCKDSNKIEEQVSNVPIYKDISYPQDYSIKYYLTNDEQISKAYMDRNGIIQILSDKGILRTHDGQFLYPGALVKDNTYRTLTDKNINGFTLYKDQFVYLDDKAVLSNAWAGNLYLSHDLPYAKYLAGGENFDFLISDGKTLEFLSNDKSTRKIEINDKVLALLYDSENKIFWILGTHSISSFDPVKNKFNTIPQEEELTAFTLFKDKLILGTSNGYFKINTTTGKKEGNIRDQLPVNNITAIHIINEYLWFGSPQGAFKLRSDGKFDYYYGKRWIPSNNIKHISQGKDGSVLIVTDAGLGKIVFKNMTLYDKAKYFEKQVRDRHIRLGLNASLVEMDNGNIDSGRLSDSDNDGLWTSMYLAGQVFRYAVTQSQEALQNCRESMEAMERLFNINPVPGFPSRSFERTGYIEKLGNPERWQHSTDPKWDWKATTSSDEVIGHMFTYGVMAELMKNDLKDRAIILMDTLMSHIVSNDLYMVDFDGKPTTWGKWNPDYVNERPKMVGDRKINSSNIIAMLQTAYHFTGKEKYKKKAFDLINKHGYLENLMRPMNEIATAPSDADDWSKMLSESWNHSDDEMYFLGYWGLYNYAFNDTLKEKYKKSIIDHWEVERPEKDGAWNIMTAITGTSTFDLEEAIWYLQQHPLDLITWDIKNSHRKDIEFISPNFREQTIKEVLPPDERRIQRHNGNMFKLDKIGSEGTEEYSAGDIWLLPYWMGRYLGVISEPQ